MDARLQLLAALFSRQISASLRFPTLPLQMQSPAFASASTGTLRLDELNHLLTQQPPVSSRHKHNKKNRKSKAQYNAIMLLAAAGISVASAAKYLDELRSELSTAQQERLGFESSLVDANSINDDVLIQSDRIASEYIQAVFFKNKFWGDSGRRNIERMTFAMHSAMSQKMQFSPSLHQIVIRCISDASVSHFPREIAPQIPVPDIPAPLINLTRKLSFKLLSFLAPLYPTDFATELAFLTQYLKYCIEAETALDLPILFPNEIEYNEIGSIVKIKRAWYVPLMRELTKRVAVIVTMLYNMITRKNKIVKTEVYTQVVVEPVKAEPIVIEKATPSRRIDSPIIVTPADRRKRFPRDDHGSCRMSRSERVVTLRSELEQAAQREKALALFEDGDTTLTDISSISSDTSFSVAKSLDFGNESPRSDEDPEWLAFKTRGLGLPEDLLWSEYTKRQEKGDFRSSSVNLFGDLEELW